MMLARKEDDSHRCSEGARERERQRMIVAPLSKSKELGGVVSSIIVAKDRDGAPVVVCQQILAMTGLQKAKTKRHQRERKK
jgi:hypothetical protein